MDDIKDLIGKAVQLSKDTNAVQMPAVLELWERAIADIRKSCNSVINEEGEDTGPNVPKRKRGRPRKDQVLKVTKEIAEPAKNIEKPQEESEKNPVIRRTSKRSIVPSKRYPMLLSTIQRPKFAEEPQDSEKENDSEETEFIMKQERDIVENENKQVKSNKQDNLKMDSVSDQDTKLDSSKAKIMKKDENNSLVKNDNICDQDTISVDGVEPKSKQILRVTLGKKSVEKHKKPRPNNNQCTICGKKYSHSSNLHVHMRSHEGKKPYSCSQCGKTFAVLSNKKRHEMTHSGIKPFCCPHCAKYFTAKRSLLIHLRQHTGERPYQCKYCTQGFSQLGTLQSHMHIHEGVKKYLCDLCGKSFRQKTQMNIHLLRHEVSLDASKKRFKCDLCSQRFISKSDRDRHFFKHSGFRPFLCNLCPKSFTRMPYLKDHLKRHSNSTKTQAVPPEERKCKICGFQNQNLRKFLEHMKKHDNGKEMTHAEVESATENIQTSIVAETVEGSTEGDETVILVVDHSSVGNLYIENIVGQERDDHRNSYILAPVVHNEDSQPSEEDDHKVALVQQGAIQFLQESQVGEQPCQTLVITEEQLAQLQRVNFQSTQETVDHQDNTPTSGSQADSKRSGQIAVDDGGQKQSSNDREILDHSSQPPKNPANNKHVPVEPGEIPTTDVKCVSEEVHDEENDSDAKKQTI